MKKLTLLLFVTLTLQVVRVFAQQTEIDSLNLIIKNSTTHDTTLASVYIDLSNILPQDSMLHYSEKAKEIVENGLQNNPNNAEKYSFLFSYSEALYNIAYAYDIKNELYIALDYYNKSLKISEKIGDKYGIASSLNSIGFIYSKIGDITEAIEYYNKSLKISEEIGNKSGLISSFLNLGGIYDMQNDYVNALAYYKKSLKIAKEIGDKDGIALSYNNIGYIYSNNNEIKMALNFYKKSLKTREEIGDKNGIASNYNNIGAIYDAQNKPVKALEYYIKALKIAEELNNKDNISWTSNNIAGFLLEKGKIKEAQNYAENSLKIAEEIGYAENIRTTAKTLSKIYEKQNKGMQALKMFKLYSVMQDSIINKKNQKAFINQQAKYKYEKQKTIDDIEHQKRIAITEKEKSKQRLIIFVSIAGLILLIVFLIFVFNRLQITRNQKLLIEEKNNRITEVNKELNQQNEEITAQRDEIETQKKIVEEIHHEISESINYATRLQSAILPEEKILKQYVSEHFVLFKPKDKVSGDFYWWSHIEDHTIITAADCTGHGVPGAFMSMLGSSFLREIVQKEYVTHTGVILRKLRKEIIKALKQKGKMGEQKDGMDMAIISINHETNIVQFSGANNPLYIITTHKLKDLNSLEEFEHFYEIKPDKMPIAIYDKMDNFITHEIQLEKGDQLYMFSDGYADQFGGPKEKKFKYKPFKRLLFENKDKPMIEQKELLNNAFKSWKGKLEQIDDVLVLGIKI